MIRMPMSRRGCRAPVGAAGTRRRHALRSVVAGTVAGAIACVLMAGCRGDGAADAGHRGAPSDRTGGRNTLPGGAAEGMANNAFPFWMTGVWRGIARDSLRPDRTWRVTLVADRAGRGTIIYRRGTIACIVRPEVFAATDVALSLDESLDDVSAPCHDLGTTLVLRAAGGPDTLDGIYLDFRHGRKEVHGAVRLVRKGGEEP